MSGAGRKALLQGLCGVLGNTPPWPWPSPSHQCLPVQWCSTAEYILQLWVWDNQYIRYIYVSVCSFRLMCCRLLSCFSGVLVLTFFVNRFHVNTVTSKDQFIIAYGGLRGAICFSLVFLLPDFHRKKLFIAATTVVILFTVFVQVKMLSPNEWEIPLQM